MYSKYLCILRSSTEAGSEYRIVIIARVVDPGKNRVGSTDPPNERGWKEGNLPPYIRTDTFIGPNTTYRDIRDIDIGVSSHVFCLAVPHHCPNMVI